MAVLTVGRFDSADGSEQAADTLAQRQAQELIQVHDADAGALGGL